MLMACSDDEPMSPINPGTIPSLKNVTCKVNEIEFRNEDDVIIGIREFEFDVNRANRLQSVSIVEGLDRVPITLRFQFLYRDGDQSIVPSSINEVFGGDILTSIDFKFNAEGNLTEFIQYQVLTPSIPPESHLFFYEASEVASDSINTRIIIFDIDRLTRDWIDVFPAIFTTGQQRIHRFDRISFRGDLLEFCEFSYNELGFLEEIVCRYVEGSLSEVWNFTYEDHRLISAYKQQPNFRAITSYNYDAEGKPQFVVSTTDGRFNWKGAYYYVCR